MACTCWAGWLEIAHDEKPPSLRSNFESQILNQLGFWELLAGRAGRALRDAREAQTHRRVPQARNFVLVLSFGFGFQVRVSGSDFGFGFRAKGQGIHSGRSCDPRLGFRVDGQEPSPGP